jgi:hypothetical protein
MLPEEMPTEEKMIKETWIMNRLWLKGANFSVKHLFRRNRKMSASGHRRHEHSHVEDSDNALSNT